MQTDSIALRAVSLYFQVRGYFRDIACQGSNSEPRASNLQAEGRSIVMSYLRRVSS